MKHVKTYEGKLIDLYKVGDWVYLKRIPDNRLRNLLKNEPAKIESIKNISKDKIKYTLTYANGWQKSFILYPNDEPRFKLQITDWIRKANRKESEKFEEKMKDFNSKRELRKAVKQYNL